MDNTPTKLPWALSQWHAISTATSPINMDGVLFQDILVTLKNMLNRPEVRMWSDAVANMYGHMVDLNNPHELTPDHFDVSVLEYIYSIWRGQGYTGDLATFTILLFTYVELTQLEGLLDPTIVLSENRSVSVLAATEYLKHHDSLETSHENLFNKLIPGGPVRSKPILAFSMFHLKPSDYLDDYYVADNITMFNDLKYLPNQYSLCIGSLFYEVNAVVAKTYTDESHEGYQIRYSWEEKSVYLEHFDPLGNKTVVFDIDVQSSLPTGTRNIRVGSILIVSGTTVSLALRLNYYGGHRDYYRTAITIIDENGTIAIPSEVDRNAAHVQLDVSGIEADRYLREGIEYVFIYPAALMPSEARSVIDILEFKQGYYPELSEFDHYSISFNGDWVPSPKFNEVFELVDQYGDTMPSAVPGDHLYRFKNKKDRYDNITDVSCMFENCATLTDIELPPSWEDVFNMSYMFYNCTALKTVKLPADWIGISNKYLMFGYCTSLEDIEFDMLDLDWNTELDTEYMFDVEEYEISFTNTRSVPSISTKFQSTFEVIHEDGSRGDIGGSTTVKYRFKYPLNFYAGITDITEMCSNMSNLKSIVLPPWNGVTVASKLFSDCPALEEVILPESWEGITDASYMFQRCTALTDVIMPYDVDVPFNKTLMFKNCINLTNLDLVIPADKYPTAKLDIIDMFEYSISYGISFNGAWTPSSRFNEIFELLDRDGNVVEEGGPSVVEYRFKYGVEWYKDILSVSELFKGADTLVSIHLPDWNEIENADSVFENCTSLTSVTIPTSWDRVSSAKNIFKGCSSLGEITIPSFNESINLSNMFHGCDNLLNIDIYVTPEEWKSRINITNIFEME